MPIIIDGYNLQRAVEKIDEEFFDISSVLLCRILSEYLKRIGDHGFIVFDGIGPPDKSGFYKPGNIEVIFSGTNTDADSIIEQKILANTAPKRLTVVSSDRKLRRAAAKRKANPVKSEDFWQIMTRELQRRKKPSHEPRAKHDGITEAETKKWLDIFDLNQ